MHMMKLQVRMRLALAKFIDAVQLTHEHQMHHDVLQSCKLIQIWIIMLVIVFMNA